jgi:hypothetical protein
MVGNGSSAIDAKSSLSDVKNAWVCTDVIDLLSIRSAPAQNDDGVAEWMMRTLALSFMSEFIQLWASMLLQRIAGNITDGSVKVCQKLLRYCVLGFWPIEGYTVDPSETLGFLHISLGGVSG